VETLPPLPPRQALLEKWGLDPRRFTLALLPGSRASEIERHLSTILKGAALIKEAIPETQFILPLASTAPGDLVAESVGQFGDLDLQIIPGQSYAALAAAHLAVVASGTATVEAALAGTPSIIVYRLSPFTFAVGRLLIRVEHVGMANLLAGERLFPELLQHFFTPAGLAREVLSLVRDQSRLPVLHQGLMRIIQRLGGPGASRRAARVALEVMEGKGKAGLGDKAPGSSCPVPRRSYNRNTLPK